MKHLPKNIIICLSLLIVVSGCGDSASENKAHESNQTAQAKHGADEEEHVTLTEKQFSALQMKVDTLKERQMGGYVEANGQLEVPPQNEATITSVIGANVSSIEVIEGDEVEKGQVLLYLSHPDIVEKQTRYLNAYNNSLFLQKEYERQKKLYEGGVGSGASFQKAEADLNASTGESRGLEAQLKQLNVNVSALKKGNIQQRVALRSPIEGSVQKVEIKTGQYVDPRSDLIEIVNTHHVHADLMVFEKDVRKVQRGQKVKFNVQSIPGTQLNAEIYSVGKTFEVNPKALHVHAEIENKEGNLIPGMYIEGKILTEEQHTLALPESALAVDGGRTVVFRAERTNDNWKFIPVEVIKGETDEDWVAVKFMDDLPEQTLFAFNNAYYLMAEMKKGEAEHSH
ncbi:efflux RND transporter periplasmic adaptor subunit [Euzebyella marina]|uniref:Efflux RND transporter periplasmic adaptor subunit n=1 Tax=Euzebyella marina TaxID=1761453 RepID=A0A3G2L691_9FLAO|nr:efflux RND transporter periplasmic adaptor subunit [Euzebyella marina]AYN67671.1 efflux RND transporter periplasmic adaptor subunit [Euzebyella marina]